MSCPSEPVATSHDAVNRRAAYQWLVDSCREWLARRVGPGASTASRTSVCEPPWDIVEPMAHFQAVEPILHDLARAAVRPASAAPAALQERWEEAYYSARILNAEAMALLSAVLEQAGAAGIPLLVVKGPAAMAAVYGDVGLRQISDLDLLCRTRDLVALSRVLRSLGFVPGVPYLHHLPFIRERDARIVELHFDAHYVAARRSRFLVGAWSGATTATLEGWCFPVMSDEHQLVFDIAHFVQDDFDLPLKRMVDLSGRLMPRARALDRATLARVLRETALTEEFSLMVAAVQAILGVHVPANLPISTSGADAEPFVQRLVERSSSIGFERRRKTAALFARQAGVARKAAFLWTRLFPPIAALQAAYGTRSRGGALTRVPWHVTRSLRDVLDRQRAG